LCHWEYIPFQKNTYLSVVFIYFFLLKSSKNVVNVDMKNTHTTIPITMIAVICAAGCKCSILEYI